MLLYVLNFVQRFSFRFIHIIAIEVTIQTSYPVSTLHHTSNTILKFKLNKYPSFESFFIWCLPPSSLVVCRFFFRFSHFVSPLHFLAWNKSTINSIINQCMHCTHNKQMKRMELRRKTKRNRGACCGGGDSKWQTWNKLLVRTLSKTKTEKKKLSAVRIKMNQKKSTVTKSCAVKQMPVAYSVVPVIRSQNALVPHTFRSERMKTLKWLITILCLFFLHFLFHVSLWTKFLIFEFADLLLGTLCIFSVLTKLLGFKLRALINIAIWNQKMEDRLR